MPALCCAPPSTASRPSPSCSPAGAGIAQFAATFNGSGEPLPPQSPRRHGAPRDRHCERNLGGRILKDTPVTSVAQREDGVSVALTSDGQRLSTPREPSWSPPLHLSTRRIVTTCRPISQPHSRRSRYGPYVVGCVPDRRVGCACRGTTSTRWSSPATLVQHALQHREHLRDAGPRKPGGSITVYGAANLARALARRATRSSPRLSARSARVFPQTHGIIKEVLVQRWPQGIPYSTPGRSTYQDRSSSRSIK